MLDGKWKAKSTTRGASGPAPSATVSNFATFGPMPGRLVASAKSGLRIGGRMALSVNRPNQTCPLADPKTYEAAGKPANLRIADARTGTIYNQNDRFGRNRTPPQKGAVPCAEAWFQGTGLDLRRFR